MEKTKKPNNLEEYINTSGKLSEWEFVDEKAPEPMVWRAIDGIQFPSDRWLVEGLFPREGISMIASISGEGKSLIAMQLAKCVSEGTPWFGHPPFKTIQTKVLYINLEMSVSEMQRRGRLLGFESSNENLIILNEDDFNLNQPPGDDDLKYKWLLTFIHENNIGFIIVDTFRAAGGGLKEEKADEVRKYFQKFQILKNSGVSIVFLEHVRKPTQLEGKKPKKEQLFGSQDKAANLEVLLMIRRNDNTGDIEIYQRKNRLDVEVKPFSIKLVDELKEDGSKRLEFQYVGEIDDDATIKETAKGLVLEILSSGETKNKKELGELTRQQVGDKNLRAALNELRETGEIDYFKDGKKHVYFIPKETEMPSGGVSSQNNVDDFDNL